MKNSIDVRLSALVSNLVIQFFVNVTKIILTRCQIFHLKCKTLTGFGRERENRGKKRSEGNR